MLTLLRYLVLYAVSVNACAAAQERFPYLIVTQSVECVCFSTGSSHTLSPGDALIPLSRLRGTLLARYINNDSDRLDDPRRDERLIVPDGEHLVPFSVARAELAELASSQADELGRALFEYRVRAHLCDYDPPGLEEASRRWQEEAQFHRLRASGAKEQRERVRVLQRAINLVNSEDAADLRQRLATTRIASGDFRKALADLAGVTKNGRVELLAGISHFELGEYSLAEDCFRRALRFPLSGQDFSLAWLGIGRSSWLKSDYANSRLAYALFLARQSVLDRAARDEAVWVFVASEGDKPLPTVIRDALSLSGDSVLSLLARIAIDAAGERWERAGKGVDQLAVKVRERQHLATMLTRVETLVAAKRPLDDPLIAAPVFDHRHTTLRWSPLVRF